MNPPTPPESPASTPPRRDSGAMARILIVDDEPRNRLLLCDSLEARGYQVEEAENGLQALAIIEQRPPDVVLLDVMMPKLDGMEVCRRLKASPRTAHIPVLIITALEERAERLQSIEAGANDYLTKPIDLQDLLIRVRNAAYAKSLFEKAEASRQEAESARSAAEQANRAKSEFLAKMSHELRTPLTAILGFSDLLQSEAEAEERASEAADLARIRDSANHLLTLINDILDLSKVEAGRMTLYLEDINLLELAHEVAATVQPLVAKNQNTLEVSCPPDIGRLHADVTKTRQILFNLVSNACKFTSNGTIQLRLQRRLKESAAWIAMEVVDSGLGMPAEQVEKMFEPFTQADARTMKQYGGTGLGLAITRHFCQLMGGQIRVRSELQKGTTFTVELPATVQL